MSLYPSNKFFCHGISRDFGRRRRASNCRPCNVEFSCTIINRLQRIRLHSSQLDLCMSSLRLPPNQRGLKHQTAPCVLFIPFWPATSLFMSVSLHLTRRRIRGQQNPRLCLQDLQQKVVVGSILSYNCCNLSRGVEIWE